MDNKEMIPTEALEIALKWMASFNRYEFFTKELYKKLPECKRMDKSDIHAAFIYASLRDKGIYVSSCGIGWAKVWDDPEPVDMVLKNYEVIFEAYRKWCATQR